MLTAEDKKWISAQICAKEGRMEAPIAAYESRFEERLEKFEVTLTAEFRKRALPESEHPRVKATALRAMDLELEAL